MHLTRPADWSKLLTSETYYADPVPHFRIYDVLPPETHDMFYREYMDKVELPGVRDNTTLNNVGKWDLYKAKTFRSYDTVNGEKWNDFMNLFSHSGEQVIPIWNEFTGQNIYHEKESQPPFVRFNHWTKETVWDDWPGTLIQDWHRDGNDSKIVAILYLGMGDEKNGEFELLNEYTKETKTYEYKANSLTIFLDWEPTMHQFRTISHGHHRRTFYTTWPINSPDFESRLGTHIFLTD